MHSSNFDVIVVGAGCAGLTAAIGLARAGFAVAVVEAAAYPGAENWSGCVYFCENLAHSDILGPEGVEALAWERRLVERGFFASDGHSLLGMTYRDPEAFRHCYTVLRPIYDHHLAQVAVRHGVALLTSTTVESLIRDEGRVIGVCTHRGPLYAGLVFLAEGDASHLVTREGYERFTDQREAPKFFQGIKQVIELPPGTIEDRFGVGPDQGVAYEMLLRNGTLRGKHIRLNMGGFVYTNRQSLSIGLVLPADNLHEHFGGDPNLLVEWFENLPALKPWLEGGKRGAFGAKIIRGGGAKDIPTLIDDGLAIGGAASAIGVDFPYPNFTGPATAMGLLLTRAAVQIRESGGHFSRDNLRRHYLEPLQQTHYWEDVEFLRRWPGYVKKTRTFFGQNLDLALGSAYIWTRPKRWAITKWVNWLRMMMHVLGPKSWGEVQEDMRHLSRALRLRTVVTPPNLGRLLLDGTVNALRDIFHRPRPNLPPAGQIRLHYDVAGGAEPAGMAPGLFHRWFNRFALILAPAARKIYANDTTPLSTRLKAVAELLVKQVNMLDLIGAACLGLATGVGSALLAGWDRFRGLFRKRRTSPGRIYPRYAQAARQAGDMTPSSGPAAQRWEDRLGKLVYHMVKPSHIHVLWPKTLQEKNDVVRAGLWHVCPAHVYEARVSPLGQVQIVVNFENCIKCETCWRTSHLVDWGRDGKHRFIYPVHSPALARVLEESQAAAVARPRLPLHLDGWEESFADLTRQLEGNWPGALNGRYGHEIAELDRLLTALEFKLAEFDRALEEEPRTIDRPRADYLEMLARYTHQLALRVVEVLRGSVLGTSSAPGVAAVHQRLLHLAGALAVKAEERSRRTWDQRYSWAAADGRQLRWHHLAGLRVALNLFGKQNPALAAEADLLQPWLQTEEDGKAVAEPMAQVLASLDRAFPTPVWRSLERGVPLTSEQDSVLRDLVARVPALDPADLAGTMHPPLRKALLGELGRRDPSLAYRAASHLWARDLAQLATVSSPLAQMAKRWQRGDEWACFAFLDRRPDEDSVAYFVPATGAQSVLVLWENRLFVWTPSEQGQKDGIAVDPLETLGLRGAGLARVRITDQSRLKPAMGVDGDRIRRIWTVLSSADLTSIAFGMADQLCRRAIQHAISRVQFPGLFHDEEARDPIGKFGGVKKMIAEMAAGRYVIETLDHTLPPVDFSASSVERASLIKAVAAETLGTCPGSLSYNAGQVFGGTGYSEDDILAKFYRDAAAWRFLGPSNPAIFLQHGGELLHTWRADGRRLATLREEAQLFEEVAQRKALQAELDGIRVLRSRLRSLVSEWQAAQRTPVTTEAGGPCSPPVHGEPVAAAEIAERLGRQDALLLATKALLLRTHARLEHGLPSESETVLVRVWLDRTLAALDEFDTLVRTRLDGRTSRPDRPVVEPTAGPPVTRYADFLAAPLPYDSGDFLCKPVDLTRPRYVPEMNEADPELAEYNQEIQRLLREQFGAPRGGLVYERYIERQHRPDAADLDFCRRQGFFRLPIPREMGGEGRRKADYYLLTTNAQRLVDVAISLTIQANTSIGTTPVLLARDKDLPKAQKDLGPFVGDTSLQQEIEDGLQRLLALLEVGDPRRIEPAYLALNQRLAATVFARAVLKSLAHRFVDSWQQAGRAGVEFNLAGMRSNLQDALAAWKEARTQASDLHAELARRREACDLFLRWVASGQISAFALTEPTAGSDTARVATRARLRSVQVEVEPDGPLRFVPEGGKETRHLLDARKLEFRPEGVFYRWSEGAEPAAIHFEEYDYETDDPNRLRYYDHGPRRIHFTDIAQLRERDGRLWYDYFELTGAKMWITNGRMAVIMCLYAKTEQGVTGFIVDRHAEGLVVGKDEEKLGQCGSPTNELSLQGVRVPRENVLGLEGRGQVNALETLNVGRAGLAMSAMAQMPGLIAASRDFARTAYGSIPDWVAWRLRRMQEDCFTAEALAHDVIGRFEHPRTKSVRMESAVSKMLVSELLHQVIETAEEIHALEGQTTLHLVEKRKRDARILNIYEGTNEVQRFSILKDLAAELAPRWRQTPAPTPPNHLCREVLELEALKTGTRQRIEAALDLFGQELWQNPNLQANCFLLAEATAWLAAADSTLGRLAWLARQHPVDETTDPPEQVDLGRRALARCGDEVRSRLRRFDEDLTHLRRGYYAPEIRAASLLFDALSQSSGEPVAAPATRITRPFSVLVVVEPSVAAVPLPYVVEGRLLEPYLTLSEADRSALETALRLRDRATAPVSITVAAAGPRRLAQALREVLSLGIDRVRLVATEAEAVATDSAAAALANLLHSEPPFDLILTGVSSTGGEEGLLGLLTAEALLVPSAGNATDLAVQVTSEEGSAALVGGDRQKRIRGLSCAVGIEAGVPLRPFTTAGYLEGLKRAVEMTRWPRKIEARPVAFLGPKQAAPAVAREEAPHALRPLEAGRWLLEEIGLGGQRSTPPEPFTGTIYDVDQPGFASKLEGPSWVIAVLGTVGARRLRPSAEATVRAARLIARNEEDATVAMVLLVVPPDEEAQRQALAQLRPWYQGDVLLLPLAGAETPDEVRCRLLAEGLSQVEKLPLAVVGEPWTEPAFARLGTRPGRADGVVSRIHSLACDRGELLLETSRARGKLRIRQGRTLAAGHTCWLSLSDDAEVAALPPERLLGSFRAERWAPRLDRVYARGEMQHLLSELKQETGLVNLAGADFIIDVGFGVGNRDGYEAVIEPLEQALRALGVQNLVIGGSRKVTEELHLLPPERQIGQSGVSINPRVVLAIGISGAPQHLNYIGGRAQILAFNRDPEAPLMTLNQRQPQPRVYPVVGDLFETVPEFIAALRLQAGGEGSRSKEEMVGSTNPEGLL
jgi:electron transfer flavoprotein-quinone oxidoreductase